MSDFRIRNFSDLTVIECDDGDPVHLNVCIPDAASEAAGGGFQIEALISTLANVWKVFSNEVLEPMSVTATFSPDPENPIIVCTFGTGARQVGDVTEATFHNAADGDYMEVKLYFHWVEDKGKLLKPVAWMLTGAPQALDLQWDMFTGNVASAALGTLTAGLKQGSDVEFAVLPYQAGALIVADITALSLVIRPALDTEGYGPFVVDTTAVDQVDLGSGNKYYRVKFNLASDALTAAFGDLNDLLIQALGGTDAEAKLNAQAAAAKIACVLEVRATHTSGIYTSQSYPLNVLQALTA